MKDDVDTTPAGASEMPEPSPITNPEPSTADRIREAVSWAQAADRDMRVRCELRMYKPEIQQYVSLPGAGWLLDVKPDIEVGLQLKQAFELFVGTLISEGPEKVMARLRPAK